MVIKHHRSLSFFLYSSVTNVFRRECNVVCCCAYYWLVIRDDELMTHQFDNFAPNRRENWNCERRMCIQLQISFMLVILPLLEDFLLRNLQIIWCLLNQHYGYKWFVHTHIRIVTCVNMALHIARSNFSTFWIEVIVIKGHESVVSTINKGIFAYNIEINILHIKSYNS